MRLVEPKENMELLNKLWEEEVSQKRTVWLWGVIDEKTAQTTAMAIHKLSFFPELAGEQKPVIVYVNTDGGCAYACFALISAIQSALAPVVCVAQGRCLSAGLPVFAAGNTRIASCWCEFMMHGVSRFMGWMDQGEAEEAAESIKAVNEKMATYLAGVSKWTKRKWLGLLKDGKEHTFSAHEMMEAGIVDTLF